MQPRTLSTVTKIDVDRGVIQIEDAETGTVILRVVSLSEMSLSSALLLPGSIAAALVFTDSSLTAVWKAAQDGN